MITTTSEGPWHGRKGALAVIFLAVLIVAALAWTANQLKTYKFIGSNPNLQRVIAVSGEGKTFLKADVATVQVTVSSDAGPTDLAATQDRNSRKADAVISYAKSQGVKEEDIKTVNYSIYPRYNYSERGQEFLGYSIRQDIQLKIRDLAKVGTILNGAVQAGANEVSGLQFTVDDPKKPQDEARNQAIADAKTRAENLAKELGVKLVRITSYSESGSAVPPIFYKDMAQEGFGRGGAGGAVPIEAGQNEIRSYITITYEIE